MARRILRDDPWARIQDLLPGKASDCGVTAKDNPGGGAVDRAHGGALARPAPGAWQLAYHVHALLALGQEGGLGTAVPSPQPGSGSRRSLVRQYRRTRPPAAAGAKKIWPTSSGPFSRRVQHQDPRPRRCARQPHQFYVHRRRTRRHHPSPGVAWKSERVGSGDRRQGLRCGCVGESIQSQGAIAIIPLRSNRNPPRDYDRHIYKTHNLVECFFAQLKQFRRIATRYEKLAAHFAAMVTCGCILLWLK